jgi:GGDEF domain-containing protein
LLALQEVKPEGFVPEGYYPAGSIPTGVSQAVLRQVAGCLRKSDTVALLERGLFGVVLEDLTRPEDALKVTHKVCQALKQPLGVENQRYQLAACMGVSIYPRDGSEAGILIARAAAALEMARRAGEVCVIYAGDN